MDELQKQIATLVEGAVNQKVTAILDKMSTYIAELRKEAADPKVTGETNSVPSSEIDAAMPLAPTDETKTDRQQARQIKSLECEVASLKKQLANSERHRGKLLVWIAEGEEKRAAALQQAQRLQLRLNTYERMAKKRAATPVIESKGETAVLPERPTTRQCDICDSPIPRTRNWNAKRCSGRCDNIALIKLKPHLLRNSEKLRQIALEEGLEEYTMIRLGYKYPNQSIKQRLRRERERQEQQQSPVEQVPLSPPVPRVPLLLPAQATPTPAPVTDRRMLSASNSRSRDDYIRKGQAELAQRTRESRCLYCSTHTAMKLYCSEDCRKADESHFVKATVQYMNPTKPGTFVEKIDWQSLEKRSNELLSKRASRLPTAADPTAVAAAIEKVRQENRALYSAVSDFQTKKWRSRKKKQPSE